MMWFWVGILLLSSFCLADDRGARPQLINDRVVPLSSKVLGESYEYLLTSLEFDQDVYINDPLMCPGEDRECSAPAACEPCDFSGESVLYFISFLVVVLFCHQNLETSIFFFSKF